jgi:hypothetical protein
MVSMCCQSALRFRRDEKCLEAIIGRSTGYESSLLTDKVQSNPVPQITRYRSIIAGQAVGVGDGCNVSQGRDNRGDGMNQIWEEKGRSRVELRLMMYSRLGFTFSSKLEDHLDVSLPLEYLCWARQQRQEDSFFVDCSEGKGDINPCLRSQQCVQ